MRPSEVAWRTSTRSGAGNNNCVEVALADRDVAVRDSKDPGGPVLRFDRAAWSEFVAAVSLIDSR